MVILRPKRWTEKPPVGAQINWGHPSTRGLRIVILLNEGAGSPRNLAAPSVGITPSGAPSWVVGPGGLSRSYDGTSEFDILGTATSLRLPTTEATVFILRRKTDTTSRASTLFGVNSGTNRLGAHVPYSDGIIYWDWADFSGGDRLTWGGYTASIRLESWVFVHATTRAIYFNGLLRASGAKGTGNRVNDTNNFDLNAGNGLGEVGVSDLQDIVLFGLAEAAWSANEVLSWVAEPYAFLLPPSPRIRVFLPSVGVPIYDPTDGFAAVAELAGITGMTGRVDV